MQSRTRQLMGQRFRELGTEHTLVVHSSDERTANLLAAPTSLFELRPIRRYRGIRNRCDNLMPRRRTTVWKVAMRKITPRLPSKFSTAKSGPRRDVVVMNAAAGIYVAGKADSLAAAADLARHSLDSGAALAKLEALGKLTQEMPSEEE
ncbi:MAG: hypothetical protein R3C26_23640 [Calditrichia bacterium]